MCPITQSMLTQSGDRSLARPNVQPESTNSTVLVAQEQDIITYE